MPRRKSVKRNYSQYIQRAGQVASMAVSAYKGVKYLKGLVNSEMKYFDQDIPSTPIVTAGSVVLLSDITQGDAVDERSGISVAARNLNVRFKLERNTANTDDGNFVRIIIFMDKFNTGTNPTVTDVLGTANVLYPINVDHLSRYRVLYDRMFNLSIDGTSAFVVHKNIPLKSHLKYTSSGTTTIYNNQIYVLYISDETTNSPFWSFYSRLSFRDN